MFAELADEEIAIDRQPEKATGDITNGDKEYVVATHDESDNDHQLEHWSQHIPAEEYCPRFGKDGKEVDQQIIKCLDWRQEDENQEKSERLVVANELANEAPETVEDENDRQT